MVWPMGDLVVELEWRYLQPLAENCLDIHYGWYKYWKKSTNNPEITNQP